MVWARRCQVGVVLAVLSTFTVTACAGVDEFAPAPTLLEASAAHPLAAPPSATASTTGPLGRRPRRERPGWIRSMVQYTSGSECDETPVRERNDHRAFTVQRLEFKRVCFSGLAEKPAPQLVLSAPGGGQVRRRAEWDLSYVEGIWGWSFRPGLIGDALSRLGTYHFTLTGRSAPTRRGEDDPPLTAPGEQLALSGRIVVVTGSEPRISFTYHPEPSGGFNGMGQGMRAGGKVTVQFAGYLPGSRHFLTIYGPDVAESGSKPLKDLPEVVIPPTGEATIYWKSAATVEGGLYGIWVQSTPAQPGGCNADLCETFEIRQ